VPLPAWLDALRQTEVIAAVRSLPETGGNHFRGLHKDEVVNLVIGGGQADFDLPYKHLTARDRALLYAYFNQLGHLEELHEAFTQLFGTGRPDQPLIVVDVGCGPFTGGLALAAVLGPEIPFSYIGVDRSLAMRELGEHFASAAERVGAFNCAGRKWVQDVNAIDWTNAPGWRPVLVIASYLLASPTLNAEALVAELDLLYTRFGRGSVTILYTNSPNSTPNRSFAAFRAALEMRGFAVIADDHGSITINRYQGSKERKLRYALLHRGEQRILDVQEPR
jgi:SAM-dependent methyltransferase